MARKPKPKDEQPTTFEVKVLNPSVGGAKTDAGGRPVTDSGGRIVTLDH